MVQRLQGLIVVLAFSQGICFAQRSELPKAIEKRADTDWQTARQIWQWAEPGYQERKSSALLAEQLEQAGLKVTRGVANIPTAFTAEYGSGKPVIGILGEYDALPGLTQNAVPYREPNPKVTYGHGCGHHLFGVASAAATIAIAEQIKAGELQGTVRFYGCPAEEGGSAKVFMVREGLFKDCDAVLHWHPSSQNSAGDRSSLARMAVKFQFIGRSAHAAGAPEHGRSALDAVELTNFAAQLLREHTPDFTRIHHVITAGGGAPNVVPDFAEVYYYIRHPEGEVVRGLYERLVKCAQAGALGTETELKIRFEGGIREIMPNNTLAQIAKKNLEELNDLKYTDEEIQFALKLQATMPHAKSLDEIHQVNDRSGTIGKGSTDVGDVSWVVPTTGFSTACWVPGTPGHSWQAVACGGTKIAKKGMVLAAKTLAVTAWDLFESPDVLRAANKELKRRLGDGEYQSLMQPGQKPPLDYRNPASR
ncbi:amidohydrolase [Thalassoroseus pseudoceratinae]|uniref:amidohydrolase n=1 Tax=Thalassoroseus pseudoceratinae TaxID=2713176 RepID=UPI001421605B|nr:amidohydrolase [Thalassoroseus pseudoceratinae]